MKQARQDIKGQLRNKPAYNPLWYQGVKRFAHVDNRPRAGFKNPVEGQTEQVTYTKADRKYLILIKKLNPERFKLLTQEVEDKFFRNKSLPDHVHTRRNLAKSIGKWR